MAIEVNGDGLYGADPADQCEGFRVDGEAKTSRRLAQIFRVFKLAEHDPTVLDRLADLAMRIECENAAVLDAAVA